jgi:anti-sigma regulatory factor (Ser/Thr protein kinase)
VARQDEVRLTVPATPEYLRLARVTATGLASRLGFTYDQVEDLRLAIDELCFALIGSKGRLGTVSLRYALADDGLEVVGIGLFDDDGTTGPSLNDFSQQILRALVDEYGVARDDDGRPSFRLVKRRTAGE